ncbi:hypothetical protein G6O69_17985 [Pseudenhygromyxa sp. WMMC2535]|uniref:hypothetical protein n=1 Tax=Pseudenhygromyxa sp. WMMC2535 TaxID=2712867 RepID=UPI001558222A|nr:hypothetical protein [Pseudenhygromyxa sp. WMMC2535]NVB39739.1 hypothetical protein [Pseudenhygromyxa sp. WMMC2535]
MDPSITSAVVQALPETGSTMASGVDLAELRDDLEQVALEALDARMRGISLAEAVTDERFANLVAFHSGLRDALLLEIPKELQPWVATIGGDEVSERLPARRGAKGISEAVAAEQIGRLAHLQDDLFVQAQGADPASAGDGPAQLQAALSELLMFESVRLRLLVTAWSSTEFEALGGDDQSIDAIAWAEVEALLAEPALGEGDIRPLPVMVAAGSLALARDAAERVEALRLVSEDERETLRMRARLRAALRELRLPESVLLENALAGLLGEDRMEVTDLQEQRPVALDGLSRQAMDQRVSRGRRALSKSPESWPSRRKPALFDLLRAAEIHE